ncbi:MAG: hypothetical protein SVW77_02215 [Candidatus Nanohaloarchaea archaeon]|nr:hypothetical protein [Candidatus Nanohaloarchaea archaeon]
MGVTSGRKGYVHALEGVIAALIVVVYLNSIVTVPGTTQWETTRISKQSEDLLSALDRSGFLDRVVLRGDSDSFNALVNTLESSLSYSVRVSGLPKRFIDVGVIADNTSTIRSSTAALASRPPGVPRSVDGSGYREGTLTAAGFDTLEVVLSDTVENGIRDYSSVNLDLDGDGDYGGTGEGPYNASDRFLCDAADAGCSISETYEIGPSNDTLVLYNASTAADLQEMVSRMDIGMRTVDIRFETFNPFDESLSRFDALWIEDWTAGEMAARDDLFSDFLRDGRMMLIHSDIAKSAIDSNYLSTLGFDYVNEYRVSGSGTTRNILYSLHGPKNKSYRSTQYYLEGGMRLDEFTDVGGHDEGTLQLRNTEITVKRWSDSVSFSTESFAVNHSTGSSVTLEGNTYEVESLAPLELAPSGQQRFESFETERSESDYHATPMEGRTYNITEYDTSAQFSQAFQNLTDLPQDYSSGPVNTVCDWQDEPYRSGDVTVRGTTYTFVMVNFEAEAPCDSYFEFVYFDLNDDGDVNDDDLADFSQEGPYQDGYEINISGDRYTVSPHLDGEGFDLRKIGPRFVGEIPVSRGVYGGGGSAALVRRASLGHDDASLLASVIARETQEKQSFTRPRSLGETSLGYTYTSSAGTGTTFGYTLETVWWFQ